MKAAVQPTPSDQPPTSRRTVLCSIGTGSHVRLLELARPSFERLAARHGWRLSLQTGPLQLDRPPAWDKVIAIRDLLTSFDTVVWIDADALVVDPEPDLTALATPDRMLWIVSHHYDGADQPNTGIMVMHSGQAARDFLDAVWETEHLIDHPWWEQAAMLELMGYDVTSEIGVARMVNPTHWYAQVGWLDKRWNSISLDPHPAPYIRHYAGLSNGERLARMSQARRTLGPDRDAETGTPSVSVIYPLQSGSVETAVASLASLLAAGTDFRLILVDDASELDGVAAALGPGVSVVKHPRPFGLATSWVSGIELATSQIVVLLAAPARLAPGAIDAMIAALESGAVAATTTSVDDALLSPHRAICLAAAGPTLSKVTVPRSAADADALADLVLALARHGRVVPVACAVAEPPLNLPATPPFPAGVPDWNIRMRRARYREDLSRLISRDELPWLLRARGLYGTGAEIGVQVGLFSHHLLTYWPGQKLLSVDAWEHFPAETYEDIANVTQEEQDRRWATTRQRLAVFGTRSEVWRLRSVDAAKQVVDGGLDFVYIDARHDLEGVLEDLVAWVPKVRPGGIIAGHDYRDGLLPEGRFEVKQAVDTFFAAYDRTVHATLDQPWVSWIIDVPMEGWRAHTE